MLWLAAAILGLCATSLPAQDKPVDKPDRPEKKKDGEGGPKEERKKQPSCGKSPHDIAGEMKKNGLGGDDLDESVAKHFKAKHPDAPCHCTCKHEAEDAAPRVKPPLKEGDACGRTVKQILESGPRVDENKVAEHFKRHHAKGDACHCSCGHDAPEGKPKGKGDVRGEKGNNGVGNGQDPQPPGKPPVNDGPGSKPGNPDRKGGDKR